MLFIYYILYLKLIDKYNNLILYLDIVKFSRTIFR